MTQNNNSFEMEYDENIENQGDSRNRKHLKQIN